MPEIHVLLLGQKMNHFSRMCRTPDGDGQKNKQVNTLDGCDSDSEVMFIGTVNAGDKDWLETVNFGTMFCPKTHMTKLQQPVCNLPLQD